MGDRVQVLTHQNSRLVSQLDALRRDNKVLEEKVSLFESKDTEYAQTLLCINRIWERMQNDLIHMSVTCTSTTGRAAQESSSNNNHGSTSTSSDPFLARLLHNCPASVSKSVADGQKQIDADLTEVEEALLKRAEVTQQALANVLQSVKQLHDHSLALAQ